MLWYFMYIREKILGENDREAYELWIERHTVMRINIDGKLLLNQKNYILEAKRITTVEIDEVKENNRLKIWNATVDHTQGMNGDKMDTND